MSQTTNKQLATFLRMLADEIERGNTTSFDSLGPQLSAILFERKQLQRPSKIPTPPKKVDAPTLYFENGVPRPMGIRKRVELADTKTSSYIAWEYNPMQLSKFAKMETIAQKFWSGDKKIYSAALKLFAKYGMIVRKGNGYEWSREYTPLARREFAKQFYPATV